MQEVLMAISCRGVQLTLVIKGSIVKASRTVCSFLPGSIYLMQCIRIGTFYFVGCPRMDRVSVASITTLLIYDSIRKNVRRYVAT